jgi:hypothetical protein
LLHAISSQSFLIAPAVRSLECDIGAKCRRCVFCAHEPHLLCTVLIGSIIDSPEVTGSASNVPSSTSNHSTITPGTSSPASSSSSKSNSNAGAIAGGVIWGIAGGALIAGLVAWFTIRRRRRHAPSADYISSQGSDIGTTPMSMPHSMDAGRLRLYVSLILSLCHVKAYETVIDPIIVLPRILRTQAHTRRSHLQRSARRTQVNRISALHRTCNPTERPTMAFQRSDSPNLASPALPFLTS